MLRQLSKEEQRKRGCRFCTQLQLKRNMRHCPHEECPYHSLDNYEKYDDYLDSEDYQIKGLIECETMAVFMERENEVFS